MKPHAANRSRVRNGALALGVATVLMATAACSSAAAPAAETPDPVLGGSLTYGLDSSPDNLDPNSSSSAVNAQVIRQIFDSLVDETEDGSYAPWLAESWETSDDGTVYTFQLRDDVTFHDGTEFNAAAVCTNFDRIVDPATQSRSAISSLGTYYQSCAATDAFEVTATLSERDVTWLSGLSTAWTGFQSPAAIEEFGQDININPVGTGPFSFESMALNSNVVLAQNPDYNWAPEGSGHQGPAYLDELTFLTITEPTTRFRSVGGDVQAAEAIATQDVAGAQGNPDLGVDIVSVPGTPYQLFFNGSKAPWGDVEARTAARAAMDIPSIIDSLYFGVYDRAWSPLSPATTYYNASLEDSFDYDPEAANKAFDELGWALDDDGYRYKDGELLKIDYLLPSGQREKREQIAQFLEENLKAVGIKVNLQFLATGPYAAARDANEYDVMGLSLTSGFSALATIYDSTNYPAPGKGNYYNYAQLDSPEVDGWIRDVQAASDIDEAAELYGNLQQYVVDNAVSVPIYNYNYTVAYANTVHGLAYNAQSYPLFHNTFLSN